MGKAKRPGHIVDALFSSGRKSKKIGGTRNHHDPLTGNRGNGGGKKK